MSTVSSLFVTRLYQASLQQFQPHLDVDEVAANCYGIAEDDEAGQQWCEDEGYPGYTSYASLTDLPWRSPVFKDLVDVLDQHVAKFVEDLDFNLDGRAIELEDIWINILPEGGSHSAHIHPHSVISGTTYISLPAGAGAIKFEDPRHAMMMAAPPRKKEARQEMRSFVTIRPEIGDVLLWESWLRHEVLVNEDEDDRISISFNYKWS